MLMYEYIISLNQINVQTENCNIIVVTISKYYSMIN